MGEILDIKEIGEGKVRYSLVLEKEEMLALQGNIHEIHLWHLEECLKKAEVIETGREKSVKYFKIPLEIALRNNGLGKRKNTQKPCVSCQHHFVNNKDIYIYVVQK